MQEHLDVEIQVLTRNHAGTRHRFQGGKTIRLGRRGGDINFSEDSLVADEHAELREATQGYLLVDRGSSQGTYRYPDGQRLDQVPLGPETTIELGPGGPRCLILIGRRFGRYLLTEAIGEGGMGRLSLAIKPGPGGIVSRFAVKQIAPEMLRSASHQVKLMFLDEARIHSRINHPNVVRVHEVDEEEGVLYIAMEYLQGISLATLLSRIHASDPPFSQVMPPDLAAALILQACAGLHFAHELRDDKARPLNVVHRDISPANLVLCDDGCLKIIDFGVAQALGRIQDRTSEFGIKGKPAYMSPEQAKGLPVDRRSDLFSLGTVLYELCTGSRVFQRDNQWATLRAVEQDQPPPLNGACPKAPDRLVQIVHRALAKAPADRPATAEEIGCELAAVVRQRDRYNSPAAIIKHLTAHGIMTQGQGAVSEDVSELSADLLSVDDMLSITDLDGEPPSQATEMGAWSPEGPLGRRYRLVRRLGPLKTASQDPQKQWFLAEARDPSVRPGTEVAVCLCGKGPFLSALDDPRIERLRAFARRRGWQRPTDKSVFAPVLDFDLARPHGTAYLVTPFYETTLESEALRPLTLNQRLALARQIMATLKEAYAQEPDFVHGRLEPHRLAVIGQPPGPLEVRILDFDLASCLGDPPYASTSRSPCWPPERIGGEPPTKEADVFALGAILYKLLGGDWASAVEHINRRCPPPSLPDDNEIPESVGPALCCALDPDARQRPSVDSLCAMLFDGPSTDLSPCTVPEVGRELKVCSPQGWNVSVRTVALGPDHDRTSQPLPFPDLPLELVVKVRAGTLVSEPRRRQQGPATRGAAGLYVDARRPETRRESVAIGSNEADHVIEVGHRSSRVLRLHVHSAYVEQEGRGIEIAVKALRMSFTAPGLLRRLVVLYQRDPKGRNIQVVCVAVRDR